MKKYFAMILALALVLSLAACGGKTDEPANNSPIEVPVTSLEILENVWGA